jgi:hypothetical protein
MNCPICGEELNDTIGGHLHSVPPGERQKLGGDMCEDFDKFISKMGFKMACIILVDMAEIQGEYSNIGAHQIILSFGRNMKKEAAAELLKILGTQAEAVLDKAIVSKG